VTTFENPYVLYAAMRVREPGSGVQADAAEAEAALTGGGVTLRGAYSLAGFRADADVLLWLVGPSADALQDALVAFRRTAIGRLLDAVWTNIGVHRDAEFNKGHIPAFLQGEAPRKYVCVYPFVRSYEWYLLPAQERSDMLRAHGMMARDYADVRANTVSAFALGDYEWLLAFESDELTRIVDLMRHLRGAEARRHTREELPFYTGIRKPLADVVADLP
jgi:hydrogen peroxide-dependent heme synthase